MSLFPTQADVCNFITSVPPASAPFRNGIRIAPGDNYTFACVAGDVSTGANGLRFDVNGAVLVDDTNITPPPGSSFSNGLPVGPNGALLVGGGASASYNGGMPFTAAGFIKGNVA